MVRLDFTYVACRDTQGIPEVFIPCKINYLPRIKMLLGTGANFTLGDAKATVTPVPVLVCIQPQCCESERRSTLLLPTICLTTKAIIQGTMHVLGLV